MTKRILFILSLFCAVSLVWAAAGIDGKWLTTIKMPAPKKQGGEAREIQFTLDLKSDGGKITGSVSGGTGRRPVTQEIQEGTLAGDKFSFVTVQKTKDGQERKIVWEGTLQGDELRGTRAPQGARRGVDFTAKRQ
jgi:hypothetical protein